MGSIENSKEGQSRGSPSSNSTLDRDGNQASIASDSPTEKARKFRVTKGKLKAIPDDHRYQNHSFNVDPRRSNISDQRGPYRKSSPGKGKGHIFRANSSSKLRKNKSKADQSGVTSAASLHRHNLSAGDLSQIRMGSDIKTTTHSGYGETDTPYVTDGTPLQLASSSAKGSPRSRFHRTALSMSHTKWSWYANEEVESVGPGSYETEKAKMNATFSFPKYSFTKEPTRMTTLEKLDRLNPNPGVGEYSPDAKVRMSSSLGFRFGTGERIDSTKDKEIQSRSPGPIYGLEDSLRPSKMMRSASLSKALRFEDDRWLGPCASKYAGKEDSHLKKPAYSFAHTHNDNMYVRAAERLRKNREGPGPSKYANADLVKFSTKKFEISRVGRRVQPNRNPGPGAYNTGTLPKRDRSRSNSGSFSREQRSISIKAWDPKNFEKWRYGIYR